MKAETALDSLTKRFGILPSFRDLSSKEIPTTRETKLALLRANGLQLDNDAMILEELAQIKAADDERILPKEIVISSKNRTSHLVPEGLEWQLRLEGQQAVLAEGRSNGRVTLPALPCGLHTLTIVKGATLEEVLIIACPAAAPALEDVCGCEKLWGVNAALYGLHSSRTIGMGDFEDLARAAETFSGFGADFLGINPVHNLGWADEETISPYSPSHRGFLNTSYIAIDQICGLENSKAAEELIAKCRANADVTASRTIDYAKHDETHKRALKSLFEIFITQAETQAKERFSSFCKQQGEDLQQFALYEALSEAHGDDWRKWPDELQPANIAHASLEGSDLTQKQLFHSWLQWLADDQLNEAQTRAKRSGMSLGLYLDLAVGSRRGGAESWCDSDCYAQGVSVGAPPDHLSPAGQNWNLSAFSPHRLAEHKYSAFRSVLRQNLRHCGVLRIDHILGMNRSFWIPDDGSAGGYIEQPFHSYLAILAIEAERNQTIVIGEDLGLVPKGFREAINDKNIHSYRVLQYEVDDKRWRKQSSRVAKPYLACFGTHDTPTMRGFYQGHDIDWWEKLGWQDAQQAKETRVNREKDISTLSSLDGAQSAKNDGSFETIRNTIHSALANSSAALVSVSLDDLSGEIEAQNIPSTIEEHPNWQRRSAFSIEEMGKQKDFESVSKIMSQSGRNSIEINKEKQRENRKNPHQADR